MAVWTALVASVALFFSTEVAAESVLLDVPYRSQLDGSPYAAANCGPTAVAMLLAFHGIDASPWEARVRAMQAQDSWIDSEDGYSDDYGVFIHYLATVVESYGLRTAGLWHREGFRIDRLREWQPADVRSALLEGHPLVVQVRYQSLPERSEVPYSGDHYIVVHGAGAAEFVYSDPYDRGGGGPGQIMTEEELARAMSEASVPRAAFAVYVAP
jgi:uncharacterized protein YvpB